MKEKIKRICPACKKTFYCLGSNCSNRDTIDACSCFVCDDNSPNPKCRQWIRLFLMGNSMYKDCYILQDEAIIRLIERNL